jgi:hypothetical protein
VRATSSQIAHSWPLSHEATCIDDVIVRRAMLKFFCLAAAQLQNTKTSDLASNNLSMLNHTYQSDKGNRKEKRFEN